MKKCLMSANELSLKNGFGDKIENLFFFLNYGEILAAAGRVGPERQVFVDLFRGKAECTKGICRIDGGQSLNAFIQRDVYYASQTDRVSVDPDLSVMDYLTLFQPESIRSLLWTRKRAYAEARQLLTFAGLQRDPRDTLKSLDLWELCVLDLLKAISLKKRLLLLDYEFSACSPESVSRIHEIYRNLCERHGIAVVWNAYTLSGIEQLADRIILFGDGSIIKKFHCMPFQISGIVPYLNTDAAIHPSKPIPVNKTDPLLEIECPEIPGLPERIALMKGEAVQVIVPGQRERERLVSMLLQPRRRSTALYYKHKPLPSGWMFDKQRYPIAVIDSVGRNAVFQNLSVSQNILLLSLRKLSRLSVFLPMNGTEAVALHEWVTDENTKKKTTDELSEDECIQVQMESWRLFNPKVAVLIDPFLHQGPGGCAEIVKMVRNVCAREGAVLVISSGIAPYPYDMHQSDWCSRLIISQEGERTGD